MSDIGLMLSMMKCWHVSMGCALYVKDRRLLVVAFQLNMTMKRVTCAH